jgi:hypothetical protein
VERQGPDKGTGGPDEDATTLLLALGKAVTKIWSNLPQDVQLELFEHAVSAQDDATRERLAAKLSDAAFGVSFRRWNYFLGAAFSLVFSRNCHASFE